LVTQRSTVAITFPTDGSITFERRVKKLGEVARRADLRLYFLNMFTAMEQIFARRFAMGFAPKQRPWASVRDEALGRMVGIGSTPLVRTGLLMQSLTSENQYSVREIRGRSASFGSSREAVSASGRRFNLLNLLSVGTGGNETIRIRTPSGPFQSLSWEAGPGFWVSTRHGTSDTGARIPPRPIHPAVSQLSDAEYDMLHNMARKFWREFFSGIGGI